MCCLKYENDDYEEAKQQLPDIGEEMETPHGIGEIVGLNILERIIQVKLHDDDKIIEYTLSELIEDGILAQATE